MTIEKMNQRTEFLKSRIVNILKKHGAVESKQLLVYLLSQPDINLEDLEIGDLEKLLDLALHRLIWLGPVTIKTQFDIADINVKTIFCLQE